jgi:hypothetical protein
MNGSILGKKKVSFTENRVGVKEMFEAIQMVGAPGR